MADWLDGWTDGRMNRSRRGKELGWRVVIAAKGRARFSGAWQKEGREGERLLGSIWWNSAEEGGSEICRHSKRRVKKTPTLTLSRPLGTENGRDDCRRAKWGDPVFVSLHVLRPPPSPSASEEPDEQTVFSFTLHSARPEIPGHPYTCRPVSFRSEEVCRSYSPMDIK